MLVTTNHYVTRWRYVLVWSLQ